jgi:hypothetical protein
MGVVAVSAGPAAAPRVGLDKVRERDGSLAKFCKDLRWPGEIVQVHFPHPAFAVEGSNDVFDDERKIIGRTAGGTDKIRDPSRIDDGGRSWPVDPERRRSVSASQTSTPPNGR